MRHDARRRHHDNRRTLVPLLNEVFPVGVNQFMIMGLAARNGLLRKVFGENLPESHFLMLELMNLKHPNELLSQMIGGKYSGTQPNSFINEQRLV
ncbi:hypothetical protein FBQ85_24685 [Cytophagia bacterium CHB2]|nr:hypothetical protein [Cytophagia bacterium CHB2]